MALEVEVQDEPADFKVNAGVSGLKTIYRCGGLVFPITLSVTVPTERRGVHMSRLVGAVLNNTQGRNIEDALRAMCREVNATQQGCRVKCEFNYPVGDQFMETSVELEESGPIEYSFKKYGVAACPCSKRLCGIGHTQRAYISVQLKSEKIVDFLQVAARIDSCFSATLSEQLKRDEEAKKITEAQIRPRFVEDLVRECIKNFPDADRVEARSFESIHAHDAISYWTRQKAP